jgi:hypothetical protein
MLIYDDQSQYVLENKGNMDTLTAIKTDIYGNMTWILQKNSEFDGQFFLIDTFGAGFVRPWRRKSSSRQSRAARRPGRGRRSFAKGEKRDGMMFASCAAILPLIVRRSQLRLIDLFPLGNFADCDVTLTNPSFQLQQLNFSVIIEDLRKDREGTWETKCAYQSISRGRISKSVLSDADTLDYL